MDNRTREQVIANEDRLIEEIDKLNKLLNQADSKNLELIELINKIYDIIENEKITGIEARLMIQDILQEGDKE